MGRGEPCAGIHLHTHVYLHTNEAYAGTDMRLCKLGPLQMPAQLEMYINKKDTEISEYFQVYIFMCIYTFMYPYVHMSFHGLLDCIPRGVCQIQWSMNLLAKLAKT